VLAGEGHKNDRYAGWHIPYQYDDVKEEVADKHE